MSILDVIVQGYGNVQTYTPTLQETPFGAITPDGGAGSGDLILTGTPTAIGKSYVVAITTTGAAGAGIFKVSKDGGSTYPITNVTIPVGVGYTIPGEGVTIYFQTVGFTSGWSYAFSTQQAAIGNGAIFGTYRDVADSIDLDLQLNIGNTTVLHDDSALMLVPLPPNVVRVNTAKLPAPALVAGPITAYLFMADLLGTSESGQQAIVHPISIYEFYGVQWFGLPGDYLPGQSFTQVQARIRGLPVIRKAVI